MEVVRPHESASMPQLNTKTNSGQNIQIDLTHLKSKDSVGATDSVPRNDSIHAQKGLGANTSSGDGSGSVSKAPEMAFINVDSIDEEGKSDS